MVLIGIDPHKGSHTAVAIDGHETQLGELRVRSSTHQCDRLLQWASAFPQRRWAIESAGGLGYLLGQQLVAAGEDVVDVPPTLSSRVRVLGSGKAQKNDPNDALSTAIAALRGRRLRPVVLDDQVAIIRLLANRHHDLVAHHTQALCRLHAQLANLSPGGVSGRLSPKRAEEMLATIASSDGVVVARKQHCAELLDDVNRLRSALVESKARISAAVVASKSSVTDVFGVGPIVARHHPRPQRRRAPLRQPGPLRQLQRHRAHRGLQRPHQAPPAQPAGQPPAQPRHAPRRGDPDLPRHPRTRLLPAQDGLGEIDEGGHAGPEATDQRRCVPPARR